MGAARRRGEGTRTRPRRDEEKVEISRTPVWGRVIYAWGAPRHATPPREAAHGFPDPSV